MGDQIAKLSLEEVGRPKVGALVTQMGRAPVADLVVVDDGPSPRRKSLEAVDVVMCAPRAAMQHEKRRLAGMQIADDAIPVLSSDSLECVVESFQTLVTDPMPHRGLHDRRP